MSGSNPLRILRALDGALHSPVDLYLFGRAALALGFPDAPAAYHATMDVDAILPLKDQAFIEQNEDFWNAQEEVNRLLGETGLYFTHLFEETQVILTPDWLEHSLPVNEPSLHHVRVWRPSTPDLILTKMMRIDPQDREDILFLLRQPDSSHSQVASAMHRAVVPPIPEIQEAFVANRQWLLASIAG